MLLFWQFYFEWVSMSLDLLQQPYIAQHLADNGPWPPWTQCICHLPQASATTLEVASITNNWTTTSKSMDNYGWGGGGCLHANMHQYLWLPIIIINHQIQHLSIWQLLLELCLSSCECGMPLISYLPNLGYHSSHQANWSIGLIFCYDCWYSKCRSMILGYLPESNNYLADCIG